jgi:DNA-binding transcriptional ArsR family regulator
MKMSEAVGVLDALAQQSRLAVMRYLIRRGPEGAPAGRIADDLRLHAATLSFHLSALRQAGLVAARRESRWIIYSADFSRVADLIEYLTAHCCQESPTAKRRRNVISKGETHDHPRCV